MTAPDPLTPADCDLRSFRNMPFDVQRFRDSDLLTEEDPETILAAILLWGSAWQQVPAGSLPNDDRALAKFAGYGRSVKAWETVKPGALRGFVLCSDGRLYHDVVSEKANEAWDKRLHYEWAKAKDRHRKSQKTLPEPERTEFPEFDDWKAGRPTPAPRPGKQGRLPLESDDLSAGTPPEGPPSARARVHDRAHDRAPTGSRTVPNGHSDGNDDQFRRNDPSIPPENALKGIEGKGIESRDNLSSPGSLDKSATAPLDDRDLVALHAAVCEAAGYRPINPTQIAASMDQVKEWRERGLDFDKVVLPAIRVIVANSKPDDRTRTLGRFRHAIAREQAKFEEARSAGRKHQPSEAPLLARDDETSDMRTVRAALLERLGPTTFSWTFNRSRLEAVEVEFGDERKPLRIVTETNFGGRGLDEHRAAILAVAKSHGFTELWK
jgi:hypothetical protein